MKTPITKDPLFCLTSFVALVQLIAGLLSDSDDGVAEALWRAAELQHDPTAALNVGAVEAWYPTVAMGLTSLHSYPERMEAVSPGLRGTSYPGYPVANGPPTLKGLQRPGRSDLGAGFGYNPFRVDGVSRTVDPG